MQCTIKNFVDMLDKMWHACYSDNNIKKGAQAMTTKTNTYTVSLTRSQWTEIMFSILDRSQKVGENPYISPTTLDKWQDDLMSIFDSVEVQTR